MENKSRFKSQSFTQEFCDMKLFSLWKPPFSHLHNIEYYEKMLYVVYDAPSLLPTGATHKC